jgi:hypothetical protein
MSETIFGATVDLRSSVPIGQKVRVRLAGGGELSGRVTEVTNTQLRLATKRGTQQIDISRIQEMTRSKKDSVRNGLLIGALAGALGGVLMASANDCDANECGEAAYIPAGVGIGAAAGIGLDLLHSSKETLYWSGQKQTSFRIQPIASKNVRGVRVSFEF